MNSITIDLNWTKGPVYRTRIFAGMQAEVRKREIFDWTFMSHLKWELKIFGLNGEEICFGYGRTLAEAKRYAVEAMRKRCVK
jgi:hypothetical protein